jgi:RNA polymerase sigma-70 factor (ECF subfamily)
MNIPKDLETFNQLYSTYKKRFIRFSQYYIRDIEIAEGIVTDALIYYWENKHRLTSDKNIPAYVLTVIKHKCLNYLHRQQLHQQATNALQSHAEWELSTRIASLEGCEPYELFAEEVQEIVTRTLSNLPARTRQIFFMSRTQNMSNQEIADSLKTTKKGVEFHITKALKILRIKLKDYMI